jgi:hypothetical protein
VPALAVVIGVLGTVLSPPRPDPRLCADSDDSTTMTTASLR